MASSVKVTLIAVSLLLIDTFFISIDLYFYVDLGKKIVVAITLITNVNR